MGADRQLKWATAERLLRDVLEADGHRLNEQSRALVGEWLDHNELGLAAETLRGELSGAHPKIQHALQALGMSPS